MALYAIRSRVNQSLIDIVDAPNEDMAISAFVDRHGGNPDKMVARLAKKNELSLVRERHQRTFHFSGGDLLRDNIVRVRAMMERRAMLNT